MTTLSAIVLDDQRDLETKTNNVVAFLKLEPEIATSEAARSLKGAACQGQNTILKILLEHGLDVDATEGDGWTALLEISSDDGIKDWNWNAETVTILLDANPDITLSAGLYSRTSLHWCAFHGNAIIMEKVLSHASLRYSKVVFQQQVNRGSHQEKTPLHLAAQDGHSIVVRLLLRHGAEIDAICTNDRTPLHLSAAGGHPRVVAMLLSASTASEFVNARTSDGRTALHLAAENGHQLIVSRILQDDRSLKNPKDRRYWTPLLRAGQNGHSGTFDLFQPYLIANPPSPEAEQACKIFEASVFDFYAAADDNIIVDSRCSVYDLLYGFEPGEGATKFAVTTNLANVRPPRPRLKTTKAKPICRWIHLPVNNLAWVEILLNKAIIEHRGSNAESYRQVVQSLDQQNRSMRIHSRHMRPNYQTYSTASVFRLPAEVGSDSTTKPQDDSSDPASSTQKAVSPDSAKPTDHLGILYLPYLHWDSEPNQRKVRETIKLVDKPSEMTRLADIHAGPTAKDEILIKGYLRPSTNLHLRRTLDQYRYPAMSTEKRDRDQVVYRYHKQQIRHGRGPKTPMIFMVDQLWVWVLDGIVITSFPETEDDPLDVLSGMISDIKLSEEPIESEMDLVAAITGRCVGLFDRIPLDQGIRVRRGLNFFEIFEESVGRVTEHASDLLERFQRDVANVPQWLQHSAPKKPFTPENAEDENDEDGDRETPSTIDFDPSFVNRLINISKETQLRFECTDIDDELTTLSMVLKQQRAVLDQFLESFSDKTTIANSVSVRKATEQQQIIDQDLANIERLQLQIADAADILTRLLDLKPRHATAIEARFARDQAEDSARSGQIIMVFTIVTIIFLPLSFLAAFFAINISAFPRDSNDALPLEWVSKYLFGIGLAVSVPLIAIAFAFGDLQKWTDSLKAWYPKIAHGKNGETSKESVESRSPTYKTEDIIGESPYMMRTRDDMRRRSTAKHSIYLNSPQQWLPNGDAV